ncbi:MAG: zinc-binding dehydrogenase [Proteobacteria bacterium]|nr:zinc-binding dehydrogenase [Pseudomonadota bacterium]
MRAAIFENGRVQVGEFPEPVPGKGHALVRTHRCGLCASDAHFIVSASTVVERSRKTGGAYGGIDLAKPIVMGHEFVGEILDYGPGSRRPLPTGTRVTAVPALQTRHGLSIVGYYPECPGGYGEYMLLDEDLLLEVPRDLDLELAALIEPLAVGVEHARAGEVREGEIPLVIGCGAIGLGVIAALRLLGIAPIVASDFDPARRELALAMGAEVVVDPRETSPYQIRDDLGDRAPTVVYECVGKAGMLSQIVDGIAPGGRIVMGGYCLDPEQVYVPTAQEKRLRVHFAGGETPDDMIAARDAIVAGSVDLRLWLGDGIGLSGVADSLTRMSDPASPVRTVVDPSRE